MRKYTRLLTTATAVGLSTSLATGIAVAAPENNAEVNPETILGENFADIASTGEFSNLIDRIAKQAQDSQAFLDKLGGDLDSLFKGGDKDKDITAALEELRDVVNSLVTDFTPTESETSGEDEGTQTGGESTEGADGTEGTESTEGVTEGTQTEPEGTESEDTETGEGESTETGVDVGTQTGEGEDAQPEENKPASEETEKTDDKESESSSKELTWKIKVSDLTSAYGDEEKVEGQQMVLIDIPEGVDPLSIKVTRDGRDIVVGTSEDSTSIAVPAFSDQELEVTATVKDGETKNGVTSMPPKDIELSALALPVDKAGAIPKVDNTELSVLLNKAQQQGNVSIENIFITEDGDILVGPDKKPLDLSDAAVGTTGSIEDIATSIISGETKVSDANSQLKSFVAALATLSDKASPEQKEKAAEYLREVMETREGKDSKSTDKTDKAESKDDKSKSDKGKTAGDLDSLFEEGGIFSDLFGGGADKEDENESKATDKDDKSETDSDKTESEDETDGIEPSGEKRLVDEETAKLIKTGLLGAGATLLVSSLVKGLKEGNGLSSSADKTESKDAKDLTVEELLKLAGESEKTGEKTTESETRTTEREESTTPSTENERESTSRVSEPREDSQSGVATEPTDTGSTGTTSGTTSGSSNTGSTGSRSGSTSNTGGSAGSAGSDGYSEGYNDGYDDAAADGAEQPASPAEADYNNAAAESMPVTGMDSSTKVLAGLAVALMVAAGAFIGIARRKTD